MTTISGKVTTTVTIIGATGTPGNGSYPNPVEITSTGYVAPTTYGADGVVSTYAGASLTVDAGGFIAAANGGVGVSLTGGGTLTNSGAIFAGNNDTTGGIGGAGVYAASPSAATPTIVMNNGQINGATSYGGVTGVAGIGVDLSLNAQLQNQGNIYGGLGNQGAAGGAGVRLRGAAATNDNNITGGTARAQGANYPGAQAGTGAALYAQSGVAASFTNYGKIVGGDAYVNFGVSTDYPTGSTGGTGALVSADTTLTNQSGGTLGGGTGATAGVGVDINGGTVIDAGYIRGGLDMSGIGTAVQFGTVPGGTLTLDSGWTIAGDVIGLAAGDSIDVTNLSPTSWSSDFNAGTQTLDVTASSGVPDEVLTFAGTYSGYAIAYKADGSGGTDVYLQSESTVIGHQIVIGSANYPSPLEIFAYNIVAPTGEAGTAAVVSTVSGNSLTVDPHGALLGGSAGGSGSTSSLAGAGVQFSAAGSITDNGTITGGYGESSAGGGAGAILTSGVTLHDAGSLLGGGVGGTGAAGTGVDINGGAVTVSGYLRGGLSGGHVAGDAVQFGGVTGGALTLDGNWTLAGDVSGFQLGDSIDIANLAPSSAENDFNSATNTLSAGQTTGVANETLQFGGSYAASYHFQFNYDGGGGTLITLAETIDSTIVIGTPNYPSPLDIRSGVTVSPATAGAIAIESNDPRASLEIDAGGEAHGGNSSYRSETSGGIGVDLTVATHVVNAGTIAGGYASAYSDGAGAGLVMTGGGYLGNTGKIYGGSADATYGGNGGTALTASGAAYTHIINHGRIVGGASSAGAFNGGAGAQLSGKVTFDNYGSVGASGGYFGADGIDLGSGATVVNKSGAYISGFYTVGGGIGVRVAAGATLVNQGHINGGGGDNNSSGGVGVYLQGGTLQTTGFIVGGKGNYPRPNTYSVQFERGVDSRMTVGANASFLGSIGGFAVGDTIDITNQGVSTVAGEYNASTSTITLGSNAHQALTFAGLPGALSFNSDGSGGTLVTVACFLRGTRIRTEHGETAIENLRIGDRVTTLSGVARPIRWIGRRSYPGWSTRGNLDVQPVLVRAGAMGEMLPTRDLWVSPGHALYLDGMLISARDLVNGDSIVQEESVEEIAYFHLEFDTHAVIFAEGAPSESFVDEETREIFDNAAEFHERYPDAPSQPVRYCAPRLGEGPELEAVRRRLATGAAVDNRPAQPTLAQTSAQAIPRNTANARSTAAI